LHAFRRRRKLQQSLWFAEQRHTHLQQYYLKGNDEPRVQLANETTPTSWSSNAAALSDLHSDNVNTSASTAAVHTRSLADGEDIMASTRSSGDIAFNTITPRSSWLAKQEMTTVHHRTSVSTVRSSSTSQSSTPSTTRLVDGFRRPFQNGAVNDGYDDADAWQRKSKLYDDVYFGRTSISDSAAVAAAAASTDIKSESRGQTTGVSFVPEPMTYRYFTYDRDYFKEKTKSDQRDEVALSIDRLSPYQSSGPR